MNRAACCVAAAVVLGGFVPSAVADESESAASGFLTGYLKAFNSGDAEAIGAYWAEDATSVAGHTGDRKVGRDAIVADYQSLFEESPGARLAGRIEHARSLGADMALIEGRVTLFLPDASPEESAFTAVIRRSEDRWIIESAHEHAVASPPTPYEALQPLAWMVGEWRDEVADADVVTTVRWSPNRAFLIRSFGADFGDGETLEGTQVIGWDAGTKRFRTWVFQSDGSFGEGTISASGDDWLIRTSHTDAEGALSAATQVLTRVDADTIRVQAIGRTVNGAPAPAGDPVTVVRVPATTAAASAGGGD